MVDINNRKGINSMSILTFENIALIIIVCSVLLAIGMTVFNLPKILSRIFFIILIVLLLVEISSEALLDNAVPTENRTEIQEIIEQKSTSQNFNIRVTYKDLSGNTKEALVIDAKTSDDDISYSYIETKTYKYGFLYKDVNTLYLRR